MITDKEVSLYFIPFNAPTGGWRANQLSTVISFDIHNIQGIY